MRALVFAHLAAAAALTAACTTTVQGMPTAGDDTAPLTAAPVPVSTLDSLLLDTGQINAAVGATDIAVAEDRTEMYDSDGIDDRACMAVSSNAEKKAYVGSGWTAVRLQDLHEPIEEYPHLVSQAVIAFTTADDAGEFFSASSTAWKGCSERRYTYRPADKPDVVWTVGPITTTDGVLFTTKTQEGGDGWGCDRALAHANNVVADVTVCSNPPTGAATRIAGDIAAKVPTE